MIDCNWDNPGADPYRGSSVSQAIASYGFSEQETKELNWKIKAGMPDAVIYIKKDSIESPFGKASNLRDMHFGNNRKCIGLVHRNKWSDTDEKPALVYCSSRVCLAVPVVCGNISRVDYEPLQKMPKNYVELSKVNHIPAPATYMLILSLLPFIKLRYKGYIK